MKKLVLVTMVAGAVGMALAMPTRSELKKVQSMVNEVMADDMQKVKAGKLNPAEAARHAEEFGGKATDEASKFLLYKGAFELYVNGGDYDSAIRAFSRLIAEVKDVPDKVQSDIVRSKLRKVPKSKGGELFALYDRIERRMRAIAERNRLETLLKKDGSNVGFRRQLAIQCAVCGDWTAAEQHFVALNGAEKANLENADFWWGYGKDDDDLNEIFRARAVALYRQALKDGKIEGIAKVLAEKRIAEVGGQTPVESVAAPEPPKPIVAVPEPAEKKVDVQAVAQETWKVRYGPYGSKGIPKNVPKPQGKPLMLTLDQGQVMELLPCPAGSFTMGWQRSEWKPGALRGFKPHEVTITRPFWMGKTMVSIAQWQAIAPKHLTREPLPEQKALGGDKCAVSCVSGDHVDEYCQRLMKKFGRLLPKGYVFRLPTEAEWEYALRAGVSEGLPMQLEIPDVQQHEYAFMPADYRRAGLDPFADFGHKERLFAVGTKKANAWGFCDLYDNGFELMLDRLTRAQFDINNREIHGCFVYPETSKDPFFWCEDVDYFTISRMKPFNAHGKKPPFLLGQTKPLLPSKGYRNAINCGFRVVAGPDLVRERRQSNRK